jgi:hypothetical protein
MRAITGIPAISGDQNSKQIFMRSTSHQVQSEILLEGNDTFAPKLPRDQDRLEKKIEKYI